MEEPSKKKLCWFWVVMWNGESKVLSFWWDSEFWRRILTSTSIVGEIRVLWWWKLLKADTVRFGGRRILGAIELMEESGGASGGDCGGDGGGAAARFFEFFFVFDFKCDFCRASQHVFCSLFFGM